MGHNGMVSNDLTCKVCEPDTEPGESNSQWYTQARVDELLERAWEQGYQRCEFELMNPSAEHVNPYSKAAE